MGTTLRRLAEKHIGKVWIAAVFAFLYLPMVYLVLFSFNSTRQDARFTGFSWRWYSALLKNTRIADGFLLSLEVAAIAATISAVLGTLAAFALVRYRKFWGRTIFSGMVNAPLIMPEVIIGLSLLLMMVLVHRGLGWPDRGTVTVVLGHVLMCTAYTTVVVQTRLLEINRSLEEAAMDLGCRPFQVFTLVTLPNIASSIVAAWLLAFTLSFDDVVIAEFLSGPGVTTLPQVVFSYARRGVNPILFAAATVFISVVSIAVIVYSIILARQSRRRLKASK